jgi:cell fate regulator YaaT (PSP1 superfamily)
LYFQGSKNLGKQNKIKVKMLNKGVRDEKKGKDKYIYMGII